MTEHYHNADCVPMALEAIAEQLQEVTDRLDRVLAVYEMKMLTDEQRHRLRLERDAAYLLQVQTIP